MTVSERGKLVKETKGCMFCLSISHIGKDCPFESTWKKCDIDRCGKFHSKLIHGCGIPEFCGAMYAYKKNGNDTLLLIHDVRTPVGKIRTFWDDGSTLTLVSKKYAE